MVNWTDDLARAERAIEQYGRVAVNGRTYTSISDLHRDIPPPTADEQSSVTRLGPVAIRPAMTPGWWLVIVVPALITVLVVNPWIDANLVRAAPSPTPTPISETAPPRVVAGIVQPPVATPATPAARVNADRLNMRAAPGPDGAIIATLERGWSVSVTGPGRVVDGWMWLPVSWAGKSGWVSARYIVVLNS